MSVAPDPEPVRSCIGCRRRRPQSALVRVTKPAAGVVVGGASDGRGAWLCRDEDHIGVAATSCLDAAIAKRAFARAWRCEVTAHDEHAIRTLAGRRVVDDGQSGAQ